MYFYKNLFILKRFFILVSFFISYYSYSQIAIGNKTFDPHAQLDVTGTQKGVLIPRVKLKDLKSPDPFDTGVDPLPESLLVYNIEGGFAVAPGYYYWSNEQWNKLVIKDELGEVIPDGKDLSSKELSITPDGNGIGAVLKDITLSIKDDVITEAMLKEESVTPKKVKPGKANEVLTTDSKGEGVVWTTATTAEGKKLSSDHLTITGGDKAVLNETKLSIKNDVITEEMLKKESVTPIKIKPSKDPNQMLTTNDKKEVVWANLGSTKITNKLESEGTGENTLTSTVNEAPATTLIVKTVVNTLGDPNKDGYPLMTTVNGVSAKTTINIPEPWHTTGGIVAIHNHQDIHQMGKVGIGEYEPKAQLDVKGSVRLQNTEILSTPKYVVTMNANQEIKKTKVADLIKPGPGEPGSSKWDYTPKGGEDPKENAIFRESSVRIGKGEGGMEEPGALLDVRGDALINGITVGRGTKNMGTNTAVGEHSLLKNTKGNQNTAIGHNTLMENTTGHSNTAIGYLTLMKNTDGFNNTAVGTNSLYANQGNANTAVGTNSLHANTTGRTNVAMGLGALEKNTTGSSNTALGTYSLQASTKGGANVAIGHSALRETISGNYNVAIGYYTKVDEKYGTGPWSNIGGEYNTVIGFQASVESENIVGEGIKPANNSTAIGNGAIAKGCNEIRLGNSEIQFLKAQVALSHPSDQRWKKDIKTIPLGLDFINKVHPVEYIRINNDDQTKEWGVIAQELQQTLEDVGYEKAGLIDKDSSPDKYLSVRYTDLIAPVIKSLQELTEQNKTLSKAIQELTEQNKTLSKENVVLKNKIDAIEKRIK